MKQQKQMKECICDNYDKKGRSTCGFPCPIHPPQTDSWEDEAVKILFEYLDFFDANYIPIFVNRNALLDFIRTEIDKARREEREIVTKKMTGMSHW